jgi:hypothetical protein
MSNDFETQKKLSHRSVWHVARWLCEVQGQDILMFPPPKDDPDRGDIYANDLRVEVKAITRDFFRPEEWPFPEIFICRADTYDAADPKPVAFFTCNPALTFAAMVKTQESREWWSKKTVTDTRPGRGYDYEVYTCPTRFIHWRNITL